MIICLPILCCGSIAAGVYAASVKYDGKAAPGSMLGETHVSGMNVAELEQTAQSLFDSTTVTIKISDKYMPAETPALSVKPAELEMALNPQKTAANVMSEGNAEFILFRYLPIPEKHTALSITYKAEAIREFLRASYPEVFTLPVNPEINYNKEAQTFEVTPGKVSVGISDEEADRIASEIAAQPGGEIIIDLEAREIAAPVSDAAATQTAEKANALLGVSLNFTVEKGGKAEATEDDLANMIVLTPDDATGEFKLEVSQKKAAEYVLGALTNKLGTKPEKSKTIEDGNGRTLLVVGVAKDGTQVADAQGVAAKIVGALEQATPLELAVSLEVKAGGTTPVIPKEGERWAEVNLSTQTSYFYEGDKVIRTCLISSGAAGHKTRVGSFKVWLKVRMQDMKGGSKKDGTYYETKNVPWITYFDGDIAFHHAYWHNNFGHPMSHGCVNMKLDDAIFVYDYLKKGDRVVVHY